MTADLKHQPPAACSPASPPRVGAVALAGCERSTCRAGAVVPRNVLDLGEDFNRAVQRFFLQPTSLAREFPESDISPDFRANGSTDPDDPTYRDARRQRLRRLAAEGRRAGRESDGVFAGRSPRHAGADADHPPRLRRGLELHRQVDRRAARARAREGQAQAGGALHPLHLRRRTGEDARRQRPLLRDPRPRGRLPPADDPRLRHERRDADRSRTARRSACGPSARSATRWRSTSCRSTRSTTSRSSAAATAASGKTAATTGTPESDFPAIDPAAACKPARTGLLATPASFRGVAGEGRRMAKKAARRTVRWGIISTANIGVEKVIPGMMKSEGHRDPRDRLALAADREEGGEEARHSGRLRLLRGAARRSRDRGDLQSAAEPPARAADARRREEGQARALREADRADGRRGGARSATAPKGVLIAEAFMVRHHPQWIRGARAGEEGQARHAARHPVAVHLLQRRSQQRPQHGRHRRRRALRHRLLPDRHRAATSSAPSRCASCRSSIATRSSAPTGRPARSSISARAAT